MRYLCLVRDAAEILQLLVKVIGVEDRDLDIPGAKWLNSEGDSQDHASTQRSNGTTTKHIGFSILKVCSMNGSNINIQQRAYAHLSPE